MSIYLMLYALLMAISFFSNNLKRTTIIYGKTKIQLNKMFYIVLSFTLMLIIQGLRDLSVGVDTKAYLDIFDGIIASKGLIDFQDGSYLNLEMGYVLLNTAVASISDDYQFFIFVSSAIILFLHIFFLSKNSKDIYISLYLFLGLNHFITSMVSLRQYIAIGIIVWVLPAIKKRGIIFAIPIAIIAFFFHNSSVIFIFATAVAYILKNDKKYSCYILMLLFLSLPITVTLKDFMVSFIPKYEFYDKYLGQSGIGPFAVVCSMLYFLIFALYSHSLDNNNKYRNMLLTLMAFAVYTPFLGIYLPWGFRLTYFFSYIPLLVVPDLIDMRWPKKKMLARFVVGVISLVFFIYQLLTNAGNVVPYMFYN